MILIWFDLIWCTQAWLWHPMHAPKHESGTQCMHPSMNLAHHACTQAWIWHTMHAPKHESGTPCMHAPKHESGTSCMHPSMNLAHHACTQAWIWHPMHAPKHDYGTQCMHPGRNLAPHIQPAQLHILHEMDDVCIVAYDRYRVWR